MIETLICIIGFLSICGFSAISIVLALIVAMFKTKKEANSGEINLKQQKKIE